MDATSAHLTYDLDPGSRIVAIGGAWDRFATDNAAPELLGSAVCGQLLWRYVAGQEVRHLLQLLFDHVRQRGVSLTVPFRCDAPALIRFMACHIHPLAGDLLRVESVLLRTERRAYVPLLERSSRLLYGTLSMCSWCKRVRLFNRDWVEVEEAVERLNLFSSTDLPNLSHGICEPCARQTFALAELPESDASR